MPTGSVACAELAVDCKNPLGEGAFYDVATGTLWWITIPMPSRIHRLDVSSGDTQSWEVSEMVSYAVPSQGDRLLVASHGGLNGFDPASGKLERLKQIEPMKPFNRSNDACCDLLGNLWVGTMQNNVAPDQSEIGIVSRSGSLFRVDPQLGIERKVPDIGISNSCCFSPDGRKMYFCDTPQEVIWSFDHDPDTGELSNKRDFASDSRGHPDGATVDSDGCVWSARYDGSCVTRFSPAGKVDSYLEVPASKVTCCTFGGPELDTLYITTARQGLTPGQLADEPHAGGLFAARTGVPGCPDVRFAGTL